MKKYFLYALMVCALISCKDNSGLYGLLADIDNRITAVEQECDQLNTNIDALETLIAAQQTGDYITAITPIMSGGVEIGYTITFAHHSPITIYHGKDGQDGQDGTNGTNGTNGTDGHTPIIGVAQDTDGVYYWTLDGEWLLDDNNNKLRVTGQDGQDGQNGQNGADGQDGQNGTNGITPQLKIEADYWYISYDGGTTWTQLGKAKGDKGDKGEDGASGSGGSVFTYILIQDDYVYFNLSDGTVIRIPIIQGAPDDFVISISLNKTRDTLGIGETDTITAITTPYSNTAVTWSSNNTDVVTVDSLGIVTAINPGTATITARAIDKAATCVITVMNKSPYFSVSATKQVQFAPGNLQYRPSTGEWRFASYQYSRVSRSINSSQSTTSSDFVDVFNWELVHNASNLPNQWRDMSRTEWNYIIENRTNANNLKAAGKVNGVEGIIFLPDNWVLPPTSSFVVSEQSEDNTYTLTEWSIMQLGGAVFLPSVYGYSNGGGGASWVSNPYVRYWTSTLHSTGRAYILMGPPSGTSAMSDICIDASDSYRCAIINKYAVRLVKDVE